MKPFYIQNKEFLYFCGRLNLNKNNEKIICGNHYQMKNLTSEAFFIFRIKNSCENDILMDFS